MGKETGPPIPEEWIEGTGGEVSVAVKGVGLGGEVESKRSLDGLIGGEAEKRLGEVKGMGRELNGGSEEREVGLVEVKIAEMELALEE